MVTHTGCVSVLEQVWHTQSNFFLVYFFYFFPPQVERSAKVVAWAWLHFLPALDACIPYVVFLTCQRRSWIRTMETKQGMPLHLACIRHTVREKWDVKRLSTAWVDTTRPYLLDVKIHFVQCNYLPSPPISKSKKKKGERKKKKKKHTFVLMAILRYAGQPFIFWGWAGLSVEFGRNPPMNTESGQSKQ